MGIHSIMARVAEIQSKIASLEAPPPQTMPASAPQASTFGQALSAASPGVAGSASDQPDVSAIGPLPPLTPSGVPTSKSAAISQAIAASAAKYHIDPKLIQSVIQVESGYDPNAVSRAGAMGLMQLMPSNVAEEGVSNPFDPEENIDGGSQQLSQLLSEFGGNLDDALAAYNAGPGAVNRYGGVPPYHETQTYIQKIHALLGH